MAIDFLRSGNMQIIEKMMKDDVYEEIDALEFEDRTV
jgi:hypothetical protein